MTTLIQQLNSLAAHCDLEEREMIEEMVINAADYVQVVVVMETKAKNFAGRQGNEMRDAVSTSDSARSRIHNSLIARVNAVNRICTAHGLDPIYTGDSERRHYGDFAFALAEEIFRIR